MPQRTIPTRIAPTARTPVVGPSPDAATRTHALPPPGPTGCRLCGRSLPSGRRFCPCGAALTIIEPQHPGLPPPPSWWREWSAHRAHRAAMQQAAGGAAPTYDTPVAPHVRLVRSLLVLLLVAVVVSQVGPWGDELRQLVVDRIPTVR